MSKGNITWLGSVECHECEDKVEAIPQGEGRNLLKGRGWRFIYHRWHCPDCSKAWEARS